MGKQRKSASETSVTRQRNISAPENCVSMDKAPLIERRNAMSPIGRNDLESVARMMEGTEKVVLAYIFGSQVAPAGLQGPPRDIDIAVLFSHPLPLREFLRFRADLTRLLKTDSVDLVSLNEASPLLKYEVVAGGKTIYTRDPLLQFRFEMTVISHFMDTQYLRDVQNSYMLGETAQ